MNGPKRDCEMFADGMRYINPIVRFSIEVEVREEAKTEMFEVWYTFESQNILNYTGNRDQCDGFVSAMCRLPQNSREYFDIRPVAPAANDNPVKE